jgi:hypothetical protein
MELLSVSSWFFIKGFSVGTESLNVDAAQYVFQYVHQPVLKYLSLIVSDLGHPYFILLLKNSS